MDNSLHIVLALRGLEGFDIPKLLKELFLMDGFVTHNSQWRPSLP